MSTSITEDEAALYDRQLRLWGVEAQNRMRNSSVLIYSFRGVAAEITKNIVLAGVGNVTLLDEKNVEEMDLGANYFVREEEVGKKVSCRRVELLCCTERADSSAFDVTARRSWCSSRTGP
jgi:molybdopterin/thiamine biosynthesis adenylyltransferase